MNRVAASYYLICIVLINFFELENKNHLAGGFLRFKIGSGGGVWPNYLDLLSRTPPILPNTTKASIPATYRPF